LEIPEKAPPNYFFTTSINNMSVTSSYFHGYVVYEDITNLIEKAKLELADETNEKDGPKNIWDQEIGEFKNAESIIEEEGYYVNAPNEIRMNQKKYFYPTVFGVKTNVVHHLAFQRLLEEMFKMVQVKTNDFYCVCPLYTHKYIFNMVAY
jgi:hypothetical protein